MKSRILLLFALFAQLTVIFIVGKCLFVWLNPVAYNGLTMSAVLDVVTHGLAMDMATAAYLVALPALLLLASVFIAGRRGLNVVRKLLYAFAAIAALLASAAIAADASLYPYWGIKLEVSPLFYFLSSPSAAMASGGVGPGLLLFAAIAVVAVTLMCLWVRLLPLKPLSTLRARWQSAGAVVLSCGVLFLAMRGGWTVSTMNLSRAYFNADQRLNHAAVNPLFSFLYSATHQSDFGSQFRFYSDSEAKNKLQRAADEFTRQSDTIPAPRLSTDRPDIYLVILESFSSHIMESLGGVNVAQRLDFLAAGGWLFTNCYASSYRTDRALPAILSGYPGQPTTSVMKFVDKTERLSSLPASLAWAGYSLSYYYGGDINFTSMNAYLVSAGFSHIVSDVDFPINQRLSKWGVPDHLVFARQLSDMQAMPATETAPRFTVVQTSSSHEPFDVPYTSHHSDKRLNAFAYTDNALGNWVDSLARSPRWERSLVVVVADHFGVWPDTLTDQAARHHIPLALFGGTLRSAPRLIDVPVAQSDIAATLLGLLGLPYDDFSFSFNVFDPAAPRLVFFSDYEHISAMNADGRASTVNLTTGQPEAGSDTVMAAGARAFLQLLYSNLQKL